MVINKLPQKPTIDRSSKPIVDRSSKPIPGRRIPNCKYDSIEEIEKDLANTRMIIAQMGKHHNADDWTREQYAVHLKKEQEAVRLNFIYKKFF